MGEKHFNGLTPAEAERLAMVAPYTGKNSFNRASLSDDDFRRARQAFATLTDVAETTERTIDGAQVGVVYGAPAVPGVKVSHAPYDKDGIGYRLMAAATDYLAEYVFCPEEFSSDYVPSDFERAMMEDFIAGLGGDTVYNKIINEVQEALNSAAPAGDDLPSDVTELVIAARELFDTYAMGPDPDGEVERLDKALEAFAERVPYENQPDDSTASPVEEG